MHRKEREGLDPLTLANASDVSHFGYFQRSPVKEFIAFVEYKVHAYNRNGLCAVGFMDDHFLVLSAFSLLNQHRTIDSVLARGERLDSLVEKSSDLSAAPQMFYK